MKQRTGRYSDRLGVYCTVFLDVLYINFANVFIVTVALYTMTIHTYRWSIFRNLDKSCFETLQKYYLCK